MYDSYRYNHISKAVKAERTGVLCSAISGFIKNLQKYL